MSGEEFEEQWRKLLNKAKATRAFYEGAVMDDNGSRKAAVAMYAANAEVRKFCAAERQMKVAFSK